MDLEEKGVERYTRADKKGKKKRKAVDREDIRQLDSPFRSISMENLVALAMDSLEGGWSFEQLLRLHQAVEYKLRQGAESAESTLAIVEAAMNDLKKVRRPGTRRPVKPAAESKHRVGHGALRHQAESKSNSSIAELVTDVPISTFGIPAQVTQIPVGQGDCYLLILPPEEVFYGTDGFLNRPFVVVIDCGTSRSRAKKAAAKGRLLHQIVEAFKDNHINPTETPWKGTVDFLIVTHPHYDHYSILPSLLEEGVKRVRRILLGGSGDDWNTIKASRSRQKLYERFKDLVDNEDGVFDPSVIDADDADVLVALSQPEKDALDRIDNASEGHEDAVHDVELFEGPRKLYRSAYDNFELECIAGFQDSTNANDQSLILVLRSKDLKGEIVNQMLFTGDAGEPIEDWLVKNKSNVLRHTTVLSVGHHGPRRRVPSLSWTPSIPSLPLYHTVLT